MKNLELGKVYKVKVEKDDFSKSFVCIAEYEGGCFSLIDTKKYPIPSEWWDDWEDVWVITDIIEEVKEY